MQHLLGPTVTVLERFHCSLPERTISPRATRGSPSVIRLQHDGRLRRVYIMERDELPVVADLSRLCPWRLKDSSP